MGDGRVGVEKEKEEVALYLARQGSDLAQTVLCPPQIAVGSLSFHSRNGLYRLSGIGTKSVPKVTKIPRSC